MMMPTKERCQVQRFVDGQDNKDTHEGEGVTAGVEDVVLVELVLDPCPPNIGLRIDGSNPPWPRGFPVLFLVLGSMLGAFPSTIKEVVSKNSSTVQYN